MIVLLLAIAVSMLIWSDPSMTAAAQRMIETTRKHWGVTWASQKENA